jgi:effector-binding domain-containing protein
MAARILFPDNHDRFTNSQEKTMNRLIVSSIIALAATCSFAHAQDKAAVEAQPAAQVGEARVRTLPAITYFHRSVDATLNTLTDRIHEVMPSLVKAAEESKAHIVGPSVLIYHGVTGDRDAHFTLDIGFPIADADAKPVGDFKIKKLPGFRCISLLYTGDIEHLSAAYEKLGPEIAKGQLEPGDESRQMMLYWEGQDSPNNVIQVMLGVK